MTASAGVLRSAASLEAAAEACRSVELGDGPAGWELANLATVGRVLCSAALAREESRGAHTRSDFPEADPALRTRLVASSG
jgi:L-aspartate oxidase